MLYKEKELPFALAAHFHTVSPLCPEAVFWGCAVMPVEITDLWFKTVGVILRLLLEADHVPDLCCAVVLCKNGQHKRKDGPWGRPDTWWGRESGHAHLPAPREFKLVLLDQEGGSCKSRGNADIPNRTELPTLEIVTAVLPLCSLMQCMC